MINCQGIIYYRPVTTLLLQPVMGLLSAPQGQSLTWWFPVRSNLESLNQFHVTLKLFGIMIYTVVDGVNCRFRVTLADWLLLAVVTILRIYGITIGIVTEQWKPLIESDLNALLYGLGVPIIFLTIFATLLPFYLMLQRRRFECLQQDLKDFDEELQRLGYPRNHQYYHFTITIFLGLCLVALMVIIAITFMLRDANYLLEAVFFLGTFNTASFGYSLFHTALNVMILAVHSRQQLLNRCIRDTLEREGGFSGNRFKLVRQLAKLNDKLCDVAEAINVVMCIPLIPHFVIIFLVHVPSLYACTRVFLSLATPVEAVNSALYLSWSGYFHFFAFQTVAFSTALRQQTVGFAGAIHRCLNLAHNQSIIDQLQQLSEQIANRAPLITFFLFDLHPSIIVQACGELATYLLILIQFDMQ